MYQYFGNIKISRIPNKKYVDKDFVNQYAPFLHLDIGGAGCYVDGNMRYGFDTAIVLSGRKENYYVRRNIAMLLHVSDWIKNTFPFKNDTVIQITIQDITSPLTPKETDEIIRCINKEIGLIEIWTNNDNKKLIATISYITNTLKCKLKMDNQNIYNNSIFPDFISI